MGRKSTTTQFSSSLHPPPCHPLVKERCHGLHCSSKSFPASQPIRRRGAPPAAPKQRLPVWQHGPSFPLPAPRRAPWTRLTPRGASSRPPQPPRARWLNRPKSFGAPKLRVPLARCSDELCPLPARRVSISWPGAATRASTGAPRRARMCTSFCSSRCVPAGQAALEPGRGRWRQFSLVLGASDDERRSCPHLVKGNVSVWKTQEHA